MKTRHIISSALALVATALAAQACSSNQAAPERICTPGAYVFCRCADRAEGTKLCKDGTSFAPCTTGGEGGECKGGEIDDPNTGRPVEPPPPVGDDDGGGVPHGPAIESCPGQPVALTPGTPMVIKGDTTGATDDMNGDQGACSVGGGGPDHVYRIQPKGTGFLSFKVEASPPLDPTVYVRSACDDVETQVRCAETTPVGGTEQAKANVITGKDYFLVVDGASGSAGKYTLTLELTGGSFCGDGQVDSGEACDDQNNTNGDGCAASCRALDGDAPSANGCPGQPVHVWPGQTVTGSGTTNAPLGNAFTKTGSSCLVSTSNLNLATDHVYEVTAHAAGTLTVTATPTGPAHNLMLVARGTCTVPSSQDEDMCANSGSDGDAETMSFAVQNGEKVAVAVDGVGKDQGSYTISFAIE